MEGATNSAELFMKKISFLFVVFITYFLSSCGFSNELVRNYNQQQTNVLLANANFRVVGQVEGVSSQFYFFGIGGLSEKSMTSSALAEMYASADVKSAGRSMAVINVAVTVKRGLFIVAGRKKAIARGTLVEFVDSPAALNQPCTIDIKRNKGENDNDDVVMKHSSTSNHDAEEKAPSDVKIKLKILTLANYAKVVGTVEKESTWNRSLGKMEVKYKVVRPNGKELELYEDDVRDIKNITLTSEQYDNLKKQK